MADQRITQRLQAALELVEIRVLDHFIVTVEDSISFAERNLLWGIFHPPAGKRFPAGWCFSGTTLLLFRLHRVPRDGKSTEAAITTLKLIVGPGDNGEPVITVLLSDEGCSSRISGTFP